MATMNGTQGSQDNAKPIKESKQDPRGYWPRIIVKFNDDVELPYEDGAERYLDDSQAAQWKRLEAEFPGITLNRLYTVLDAGQIREMVKRAVSLDPDYTPPNFLAYFVVDCPANVTPETLAAAFNDWEIVQIAYFDPPGSEPIVTPGDDPRSVNQGYLGPADDGIDAEFAWPRAGGLGFTGGDGAGIRVIDLERGWTLNHEDLVGQGATLLHGAIRDGSKAHGTSVLGELCAVDNTIGCIGIAPNVASVHVVSYWTSTRANAILAAIDHLEFGDVLLLEAQLDPNGGTDWYPIEVLDAEYDTIRLATALGLVVVEAAANGSNDLDAYTVAGKQILNRASADFRDSGAILVGAASSALPHTRFTSSNYGNRVDCYAWGENINTLSSDNLGSTNSYTAGFGYTSGASSIVTGAALILQGIAEANLNYRFSPRKVRAILSYPASGTASDNPAADRIGVMPDLRAILQSNVLNLAPDVYIRDFAGDTGDPHAGAISASPDIILLPATVANPQIAYGEGSGTENDSTLGSEVKTGQDNHIYCRVRNRGGSAASNLVVTVFWAPVATLLTPDMWTLAGSATLPNVSAGNLLTVSPSITWPQAAIPGPGHYCFVGIIGNADDPAPDPAEFLDWGNFQRFIRENNNVTWRNFNVVPSVPAPGFTVLPFLAPGAPDRARRMRLKVVAKLPARARLLLELPSAMGDAVRDSGPFIEPDDKTGRIRVPVNPHGEFALREFPFPAKARARMKLLVQLPKECRGNAYELFVQQFYKEEEVGRVTWRLVPAEKEGA